MVRLGRAKVRTGCVTCKIRKVKCDEGQPSCLRCTSTGRKCDGYGPIPTGHYSWNYLTQPGRTLNTLSVNSAASGLRGLAYFMDKLMIALDDPLESTRWTHMVIQAAEHEPAVSYAVSAISDLYACFGNRDEDKTADASEGSALWHYNRAIRELLTSKNMNRETTLLVCILFICIEFLRGHASSAIAHVIHGSRLLAPDSNSSKFSSIFRRLSVFPYFFARTLPPQLAINYGRSSSSTENLRTPAQAQESLDVLAYQVVRLVRMTDYYRLGFGDEVLQFELACAEQARLTREVRNWGQRFRSMRQVLRHNRCHASLGRLEVSWLVMGMWTATCLARDEMVYDQHKHSFARIIELASAVQVSDIHEPAKFSFVMGYGPLLYFVVLKCRFLDIRLKALALLRSLACDREVLWDKSLLYATGKRVIELEHHMEVPQEHEANNLCINEAKSRLPSDKDRIRDNMLEKDIEVHRSDSGVQTVRRKICFLTQDDTGNLNMVYEWLALAPCTEHTYV
jgi:hypothetical protein